MWAVSNVGEYIVRDLTKAGFTTLRFHGVNIHNMDEFGVNKEYQNYMDDDLAGSLASSDVEFCIFK